MESRKPELVDADLLATDAFVKRRYSAYRKFMRENGEKPLPIMDWWRKYLFATIQLWPDYHDEEEWLKEQKRK